MVTNEERMFLHLTIQTIDSSSTRDLLIADISGEHIRDFLQFNEPGPLGILLQSATVVALLIDGELLAQPDTRYHTIAAARTALRLILERSNVRETANIVAVLTKWDRCVGIEGFEAVVERVKGELTSVLLGIELVRTAARPHLESSLEEGTGTADFLNSLLTAPPEVSHPAALLQPASRPAMAFQPGGRILAKLTSADRNRV